MLVLLLSTPLPIRLYSYVVGILPVHSPACQLDTVRPSLGGKWHPGVVHSLWATVAAMKNEKVRRVDDDDKGYCAPVLTGCDRPPFGGGLGDTTGGMRVSEITSSR